MTDWFSVLIGWVLRIGLLLAGLVFVLTMVMIAGMLLALWLLRALWAKLTGKPIAAWDFQLHRHANWQRFYRGQGESTANPSAPQPDSGGRDAQDDVTDVKIKRLEEPPQDGPRN